MPDSPNSLFSFHVTGLEETIAGLDKISPAITDEAVSEAALYLVTTLQGPEGVAPYSYVSWDEAGGFVSDRQRAFVMAGLQDGEIPTPGVPHRTGAFQRGWRRVGAGRETRVENDNPAGPYLMVPGMQSRMHELQGWQTVPQWLGAHMNQIREAFAKGVQRVLEKITDEMQSGQAPGL